MIELSLGELPRACGGTWQGNLELLREHVSGIVTDSRQVEEGSLFIAFRGEKVDGHRFIPDVLSHGAMAVLCEEPGKPGEPRIIVPHVMDALRQIALYNRSRLRFPFVGITGSVGKTTAKEMTAAVLSARFRTFKTPGSMNGQIGVPIAFMSMSSDYEAAVIEMGVSQFGEMTRLTEIVQPDYAVFTNIGDAHLEFLHDRAGVLRAKSEILKGMKNDAVVFANGDDALLRTADFQRKTVLFGLGENCQVRATDIRYEPTKISCQIVAGERSFPVTVPGYGGYMIYSVLSAAAVGMEMGLSDEEIARGLLSFSNVGHRSRIVQTPLCTLIDDCYNANPTSNDAAIDSMKNLPGRKVCILGDMREMGETSAQLHRELGLYAVAHGVDLVLTEGDEARYISEAAGEKGIHFPSREALLSALPGLIQKDDVVLVKASRGAHFENVVDVIEKMK